MAQELKIRISNSSEIEQKLKSLGAAFIEETNFSDTYFNQPTGEVLKITTNENSSILVELKATNGQFEIVSRKNVENVEIEKKELSDQYGIKSVLQGKRMYFELDDLKITISLIYELGQFLILIGENPTESFITEKLGIKNPEYIKVSFDELKLD